MKNLHTKEGIQARFQWLKERFQDDDDERDTYVQRMIEAVQKIKAIPSHQNIVIWTGNNAHEQTDYALSSHC